MRPTWDPPWSIIIIQTLYIQKLYYHISHYLAYVKIMWKPNILYLAQVILLFHFSISLQIFIFFFNVYMKINYIRGFLHSPLKYLKLLIVSCNNWNAPVWGGCIFVIVIIMCVFMRLQSNLSFFSTFYILIQVSNNDDSGISSSISSTEVRVVHLTL